MNVTLTTAAPSRQEDMTAPFSATKAETRGLRLIHLWAIVPLAIAWFAASIDFIEPYDFWWNLKSGQIMTQTGQFLGTDVLVWSPVRLPYSNPQWGSQLLFYWIFALSPYLLLTVRAIIITATMGIILATCFSRSKSLRVGSIVTLVAYLTSWTNFGVRPQLFAFIPFVASYFILERKDSHPKWLPLLVPIMLFWVNVHGSFFLGVALIGIYVFGTILERVGSSDGRRWFRSRDALWQFGWFAAAGLVTVVNPYFTGIYQYFFVATNDPIARALNIEWQPPTIYNGTGILFFANVSILLATLYVSKRRLRPTEIVIMLAFAYLALTSLRNVMWWAWVTAPIVASNLSAWAARSFGSHSQSTNRVQAAGIATNSEQEEERKDPRSEQARRTDLPALNWLVVGILVGGALLFTPLWRQVNPLVPETARSAFAADTPTGVGEFLKKSNVPAPIFNYMEWGGFLEWELYPRYRMFIDGRFEARQIEVWKDYLLISQGRADWQKTLDHYGVRTLVLNKSFHDGLIPLIKTSKTWEKVYEDKTGLVYTR